jgi:hypothetical protein
MRSQDGRQKNDRVLEINVGGSFVPRPGILEADYYYLSVLV